MDADKSNSLFWRYGARTIKCKKTYKNRVERIYKTGGVRTWVKDFLPHFSKPQNSEKEIKVDLQDRVSKLAELLSEGILSNEEAFFFKKELEGLKGILLDKSKI